MLHIYQIINGFNSQEKQENAPTRKTMISRYRTLSTIITRSMRGSLLLAQEIARFGKRLGMILCGDYTGNGHQQYWLNGIALATVSDSDSPRLVDGFANLFGSEANGEPSRAWSQGRWQHKGRIRP